MAWPQTLQTARCLLRPLREGDLPVLVQEIGQWDVAQWLVAVPHPYSLRNARDWLATCRQRETDGTMLHRVVEPLERDEDEVPEMVGAAALIVGAHGPGSAELGYWFAMHAWGAGYATEVARVLVGAGFRDLGLDVIQGAVDTRNAASNAVCRKLGFRLSHIEPAHDRRLRGEPAPAYIWRLERADWNAGEEART